MKVYDIEIIKPPVPNKKWDSSKYKMANGWNDFVGMGVAVVSVYDYETDKVLSYVCDPGVQNEIQVLKQVMTQRETIVGFNIIKFDNPLLRAHGVDIQDGVCYDILKQLWFASGLSEVYNPRTHGGYNLDAVIRANFGDDGKMMSGADAPYLWQDGEHQKVIDYCEDDVRLTTKLMNRIFEKGGLINPRTKLEVKMPMPYI